MILDRIQLYAAGGLVVVLLALAGLQTFRLSKCTIERDRAQNQLKAAQLVIEGFRLASLAQAGALDVAAQRADLIGERTRMVVAELKKEPMPKTDDEARQWAIAAAGRIK